MQIEHTNKRNEMVTMHLMGAEAKEEAALCNARADDFDLTTVQQNLSLPVSAVDARFSRFHWPKYISRSWKPMQRMTGPRPRGCE